jgi:DNA-binding CsgD family transcriptional regulator
MAETTKTQNTTSEQLVNTVLTSIDKEREREIIARRFGLFERKETLEQIGETLGITRERVRQLEKSVMTKFKSSSKQGKISPDLLNFESKVIDILQQEGNISRISTLASKLVNDPDREEQSRVAFLAQLCPSLIFISEDDNYYNSVGVAKAFEGKNLKDTVEKLVDTIKAIGEPKTIKEIAKAANMTDISEAEALAGISKHLATLNGLWGLIKWPMVNPKNIRDKIYVILSENHRHMHFNEIAAAIKQSDFKRRDVTTQAIHNELIKDKRFVLIGRGIYALKEWGYEKGTVADIITNVLQEAKEPLHRDEIVKRVLKNRFVKETTILLNLQGKPQFKRVAKATYTLAQSESD